MEQQSVAALFISDVLSNFAWIQLGAFILTVILALISAGLASRAYAALSEARLLFWEAKEAERAVLKTQTGRRADAHAINDAAQKRRLYRRGRRGLL